MRNKEKKVDVFIITRPTLTCHAEPRKFFEFSAVFIFLTYKIRALRQTPANV